MGNEPKIETAFILAAGFGTRLAPLNKIKPKGLFPILHDSILGLWVKKLRALGFKNIVLNAHHLAGQICAFAAENQLTVSVETEILGTGGGIKNAHKLLGSEPFLLVNGDIYTDFPLEKLISAHKKRNEPLATLALIDFPAKANVAVAPLSAALDDQDILAIRDPQKVPGEQRRLAYGGMMVLSPEIFTLLPEGPSDIIDALLPQLNKHDAIRGCFADVFWLDMGTLAEYFALNKHLAQGHKFIGSKVDCGGRLEGFVIMGAEAKLSAGAKVTDSIIWPGVKIGERAIVKNSIIAADLQADTVCEDSFWPQT